MADNRLAENAGWDETILATELQFLTSIDCDFDVTVTGFGAAEVDLLIQSLDEDPSEAEDLLPEILTDSVAVSRIGDL